MRIGISTRGLYQGSHAISSIVLYLTRKLIEIVDSRHEIYLYLNDPLYEKSFDPSIPKRSIKLNNRFIWDHCWLPKALKEDQIDIALFMKGTMPVSLPCRGTVIYHDLGYFDHKLRPYGFIDTIYMKIMMRKAAQKAGHVFADSKYTRDDAIRLLGIPDAKISVCYPDCSPIYKPVLDELHRKQIIEKYHLPSQFIFYPSSNSPRKNLDRILDAFNSIQDLIPQALVITGEYSLIRQYKLKRLERIRVLDHVAVEDMPALYSLSDFTIYPSLLEGFGMPVLEAFRCDSPLLTSNCTSIPEVAGNAAYLIDPTDTNQIANGLIKLATDSELRNKLIEKGRERAVKFSWDITARIILQGLESVA